MLNNDHLTDDQAIAIATDRVSASESEPAAAHLAVCAQCAAAVGYWQRAEEAARRVHTIDAPESAVRRAVALFDPSLLPAPGWKRLLAAFVFDSRREAVLAGVRDAGASFQLLAQAGDIEVDLLCEPEGDGWRITGQVLADTPTLRAFARVVRPTAIETALSETGEFQLRGLASGEVVLEIELDAATVSLDPFWLGGQSD